MPINGKLSRVCVCLMVKCFVRESRQEATLKRFLSQVFQSLKTGILVKFNNGIYKSEWHLSLYLVYFLVTWQSIWEQQIPLFTHAAVG